MTKKVTNKRVIGHHTQAEYEEYERPSYLKELAEEIGIEPMPRPDYVWITEGDVDWESSREVHITVPFLREIALEFTDLQEPETDE